MYSREQRSRFVISITRDKTFEKNVSDIQINHKPINIVF